LKDMDDPAVIRADADFAMLRARALSAGFQLARVRRVDGSVSYAVGRWGLMRDDLPTLAAVADFLARVGA
jgi:hypothetical protein